MKKNISLLLAIVCLFVFTAANPLAVFAADNTEIIKAAHYNGNADGEGTWGFLGSRVANLSGNFVEPVIVPNTVGGDAEYVMSVEHLSDGQGGWYNQSVITWQTLTSPITNYLSGEFEATFELHPVQTTYPTTVKFRMANANSGATTADFIGLDVVSLGGYDALPANRGKIMVGSQDTGLYYKENETYSFKVIADTTNDTYSVYLLYGAVSEEADGVFENVSEETLLGSAENVNNNNFGFVRSVDFIVTGLPKNEDKGVLLYLKSAQFKILPLRGYLKADVSEGDTDISLGVSHWVAGKGSKSDTLSGTILVKKNGIPLVYNRDYTVTASYCQRSSLNSWSRNPVITLSEPIAGGDTFEIDFNDVADIMSRKIVDDPITFTVSARAGDKLGVALETLGDYILGENADFDNITSDLNLATDMDGVEILWTSSNEEIISHDGQVTCPASFVDAGVTLTAELSYEGKTYTKVFNCIVKTTYDPTHLENAREALSAEMIMGENSSLEEITTNLILPTSMDNGITVSWMSSNKNAIDLQGNVTRPTGYNDYSVLVTATLTDGIGTYTKPFTCIVKTTFDPNRPPQVSDVSISGIERAGSTIKLTYAFDDVNKLADKSVIQWQYSSNGTDFEDIEGANSKSLLVDSDYTGKYIRAQIQPVNLADNKGEFVYSKVIGPVLAKSSVSGGGSGGGSSSRPSSGGSGSVGGVVSFTPPAPTGATTTDKTADNTANVYSFSDVADSHWAASSINKLASAGIVSGDENGTFRPDDSITREEFVKLVVEALNISGGDGSFADMDKSYWAYKYAAAALNSGIITGYEDGTFRGNQPITREEIAVILKRATDLKGWKGSLGEAVNFADKQDISDYAVDSVSVMSAAGVINGMPDGRFLPGANATRAQAAKMISEVYANVQ